ncbi:HAD family phosphatase [Clostridiaceae bacterium UIB06]|uniref:HAD family phosphatase n=1 Tax=Clostridium thailandense TaxID=2794346 RepID=A0A949TXE1_9CLOT|nr:HAD family phosphatase [Clostridium thailandense]MBV7273310.1 HAD family phosphatase [Clostridium thailandense]MCH5137335.1 HAD family phosphatase [Clostridiaceae bacterium UIB06]
MLKNIKGAIFDMDGTLIDSMWVWSKIDEEYLRKRNIQLPNNLKQDIEHMSFSEVAQYFKDRFNITDSIEEIQNEWNEMALYQYAHKVDLKPGAKEFLTLLKSRGIKLALATSNSKPLIEIALKKNDIYHFFDSITTTDEVLRGKDFPDVYLLAAKKLSINANDCVVFEDILPAIKGAKAAGMTVIGVHDTYSDYQKDDIINLSDMYIYKYLDLIEAV